MSVNSKKYNVLVTRPKHQSDELCRLIEQQGWNPVRFPTLKIVALDKNKIKHQLELINQYQWLIFISANAVNFALRANDGKIDRFKKKPIVAVGKATEKALHSAGLSVALIPEIAFNSEGLLATKEMNNIQGQSCLIIRGEGGREILADRLRERGGTVDYMEVYKREMPVNNNTNVVNIIQQGMIDVITITSGTALKNLMVMIAKEVHDTLVSVPLIVISHRVKELAEQAGFNHIAVTERPGDAAIIETAVEMKSLATDTQQYNKRGRV